MGKPFEGHYLTYCNYETKYGSLLKDYTPWPKGFTPEMQKGFK